MVKALMAAAFILLVVLLWISVDRTYQAFARQHPQLGPFRRPHGDGGGCRCSSGHCATDPAASPPSSTQP